MTQTLVVVMNGQVAGHVTRATPHSGPEFTYSEEYLTEGTVPLSVRMPIGLGTFRAKVVVPFLEGLLPENAATRRAWADRLQTSATDAFSLLARMGWDCPGAVQFCLPEELDDMLARSGEVQAASDEQIAERLRRLRRDAASWSLPDEHWSLPGQQEKFTLVRRDGRWYEAKGSTATTHIIKPGIGTLLNQAIVEYATMRAADAAGLDVAQVEFTHFQGEAAIVIERFDRLEFRDAVMRLHQEDFCQAVGMLPERKYEDQRGPSLVRLAEVIAKHSRNPHQDRWALAEFAAINYIAGAPDGHAKNISLALWPNDVHVAPLYDLATAFPYDNAGPTNSRTAFSIGGRRDFGRVLGKHWDRAAREMGLDAEEYRLRVRGITERFPDAFADALTRLGLPEAEEIRERAMPRLGRHAGHILERLNDPLDPDVSRSRSTKKSAGTTTNTTTKKNATKKAGGTTV